MRLYYGGSLSILDFQRELCEDWRLWEFAGRDYITLPYLKYGEDRMSARSHNFEALNYIGFERFVIMRLKICDARL